MIALERQVFVRGLLGLAADDLALTALRLNDGFGNSAVKSLARAIDTLGRTQKAIAEPDRNAE